MKIKFYKNSGFFLLMTSLIVFNSCKDKTEDPAPITSENAKVNTWIKDVMDEVYFWLDDMKPAISLESTPEDFFESLLFTPTDRFSVIYPDYQELVNSLQGISKEAGYEITLARESSSNNNVIAFITYVKKRSPAETANLKRGDLITQINGVRLNLDNYQEILGQRSAPHSISYFRYDKGTESYAPQPPVDLNTVELSEDPNFLDSVYTIGNQKIGYVVYHFFAPGIQGQSTKYDDEMDAVFAKFKAEGINNLILDFRYNGGGFQSSAVNLASLIAPGVTSNDILSKNKYNRFLSGFPAFENDTLPFKNKSQNLGPILTGNKLYIITSSRTASASELIINGLKPYMDVFLVGGLTFGKNVGSFPIEDVQNPSNKYALLPIVFKSFNKNDQSDYSNGFLPNLSANELSQPFLGAFGDTEEYLLKLTLEQILGIPSSGKMNLIDRIDLGSSIENQTRFGKLIDDQTKFKR